MLKKIDHVAIVVRDLDAALAVYHGVLGLTLERVEEVPVEKVRVAFLPMPDGNGELELVQPTDNESGIARFLEKRGEGVHHICFGVDDIQTAMRQMVEQGMQVLEQKPRVGSQGQKYVFVHPKSAHGVLIELYEKA